MRSGSMPMISTPMASSGATVKLQSGKSMTLALGGLTCVGVALFALVRYPSLRELR